MEYIVSHIFYLVKSSSSDQIRSTDKVGHLVKYKALINHQIVSLPPVYCKLLDQSIIELKKKC